MSEIDSQTKAQLASKYARDEPEVTASGTTESCGWSSCNTQVKDTV